MSLINKMLRDLDQRQAGGASLGLVGLGSPAHPGGGQRLTVVAVLVAALAGGGLAAAWWLMPEPGMGQRMNQRMNQFLGRSPAQPVAVKTAPAPAVAPPAAAVPATAVAALAVTAASAAAPSPLPLTASAQASPPASPPAPTPAPTPAPRPERAAASGAMKPLTAAAPTPAKAAAPVGAEVPAKARQGAAVRVAAAKLAAVDAPEASPAGERAQARAAARAKAVAAPAAASAGKSYTPRQLAANLLREAVQLDRQGHPEAAKVPLRQILAADPLDIEARQLLIQLLLEGGRMDEARSQLDDGLKLMPDQPALILASARLRAEGGDMAGAVRQLEAGLPAARDDAPYRALLGALLLRQSRHEDALKHYLVALQSDPANPSWLIGTGMALEATGRTADAAEAYDRASSANKLTPETVAFLNDRLSRLRR